jgi:hypothetical protein
LEGAQFTGACPRQAREVGNAMKDRILVVTSFEEEEEEEEEEEGEEEEEEEEEIEIGGDGEVDEEGEEEERVIDYGVSLESDSNSNRESESMYSDSNSNSSDGDNDDRLVSDLPPPSFSSSTSYLDFRALFASTSTSSSTSFLPTENKDVLEKEANQLESDLKVGINYPPPVTGEIENEKHVSSMGNMLCSLHDRLFCHDRLFAF